MQSHSRIFTDKYLDIKSAHPEAQTVSGIEEKNALIKDWQDGIRSGRILQAKEEQLQSSFLRVFFGDVLGYVHSKGSSVWNLEEEQKTIADSTKMDGALGFFSLDSNGKTAADIRVVIELKDARTDLDKPQTRKNDRRTPVQQAFDYASAVGGTCRWVIVSNFVEIRVYFHNDRTRYESFDILSLDRDMKRFLFLLHKDRLISQKGESFTDTLYRERQEQEKNISRQFYADYRHARLSLFHHIREQNADISESLLLTKTQKLLDRILFVCFCEDFGILPYFTFRGLLKNVKEDRFNRSETKIYERVKALFDAINRGYPEENINKFNGGLFADDEILDNLIIKDVILEDVIALERYDFASDLNVNILGHIFEQSVTDMEELKAEIAGQDFDRKKGKRKKEGIFYTPEYITRYIVEEAVGGWLADRKTEIGFDSLPELTQADYDCVKKTSKKRKMNKNIDLHIQALEAYREKLRNIRVLDPACGSGAFLNQVFDFLYKEGQKVNNEIAMLKGGQREVFDLDKDILTNNIFGVDLNDESAEITKLSLWLKTANKNKELTTLDANIKCGNSLIDDPAVAGEKAFDWNAEFPEIMQNGGFDVVVGNPPWGAKLSKKETDYICRNYKGNITGEVDTFIVFTFKSFFLLKQNGYAGFIIPDTWLTIKKAVNLRNYIYNNIMIIDIYDRYKPFPDAKDTRSHTIIWKNKADSQYSFSVTVSDAKQNIIKEYRTDSSVLKNTEEWNLYISTAETGIFEKMETCSLKLKTIYNLKYGLRTGKNDDYLSNSDTNCLNLKIARGSHIERYYFNWKEEYLLKKEGLPSSYFEKECLEEKIIIQRIRTNSTDIKCRWIEASYIEAPNFLGLDSTSFIYRKSDNYSLKYLLAIISSYLMNYYYKSHYTDVNVKPAYLENLPIADLPMAKQQPFIDKTDIMLTQNKALHHFKQDFLIFLKNELKPVKITSKMENWPDLNWDEFKTELKKAKVKFDDLNLKDRKQWQDYFLEQREKALKIKGIIDKTDKEIDKMVYDLYGLTKEEIRIVEGADSKLS
ncbi:MAG: DNA methyltransferase [Desulfococcaceae bacterium]